MQATASMCRPAIPAVSALDTRACPKLMQFVFSDFLVNNRVEKVLLAASWKDEDIAALSEAVDVLKARGIDVVVFGPIVEYDRALPRLLADQIRRGVAFASDRRRPGIRERGLEMSRIVTAHGATYLSIYDAICPQNRCDESVAGDVPIQFDTGHLTAEGSVELGRRLSPSFTRNVATVGDAWN